ncbi:MAG: M48 family metallopeptidase [Candidatus Rokuibacteriota bacterium]
MTFFEHQARARRKTGVLVAFFGLAVLAITAAVNLVVAGVYVVTSDDPSGIPAGLWLGVSLATVLVIAGRSLIGVYSMRGGGDAVARMAGGVPVERDTRVPAERRLLNVVDEMAIASGVAVPRVYVLRGEGGINAFAAGWTPTNAAVAVTEGALTTLNRDELQGVVAHEFSHILNGDVRLNVRMIGVLTGILFVGAIGEFLARSSSSGDDNDSGRTRVVVLVAGLGLAAVGYAGLFFGRLIKAAVSREREFLSDASAVQFTRNPDGLAGALATIGGFPRGSRVAGRHAETLSHMFFAEGISFWFEQLFATHPPILERIRRVNPRFVPAGYVAARSRPGIEPERGPVMGPAMRLAPPAPPRVSAPVAAVVASVGRPMPAHVDQAATLLAAIPPPVREAAETRDGAQALVLAFSLARDERARKHQLGLLEGAGLGALTRQTEVLADQVQALAPALRFPVVALALPSLRALPPPARAALVENLERMVEADQRVTIEEFTLLTLVRQHLRPGAGRPDPVKYRSILGVADDACLVLSLLAHAGAAAGGDPSAAFSRGAATLRLDGRAPVPLDAIAFPRVTTALERLRLLAPFLKSELLTACVQTVIADDTVAVLEAEVLRTVAAALDCPLPPILGVEPGKG